MRRETDDGPAASEYAPMIRSDTRRIDGTVGRRSMARHLLDSLEEALSRTRYLCGDRLTEADVCTFTTLFRFDPVDHGHHLRALLPVLLVLGEDGFEQR
jgi:glutathione S-transferase